MQRSEAELDVRARLRRTAPASASVATASSSSNNNSKNSSSSTSNSARSLLSRLFRPASMHSGGDAAQLATGLNALRVRDNAGASTASNKSDSSEGQSEDTTRRRESAPAQMHTRQQQQQQQPQPQMRTVLAQGYATKLPAHKYWHAKATYFVLEEEEVEGRARVVLRQFRRYEDVQTNLVLSELVLSPDDVVADISGRHAKFGFELHLTAPEQAQHQESIWANHPRSHLNPQSSKSSTAPSTTTGAEARTLRFAVADAGVLECWVDALGSAIAKLILQIKRHYSVDDLTGIGKLVGAAKVAPILSAGVDNNNSNNSNEEQQSDSEDSDESLLCEEIRQAEQQESEIPEDEEEKPRRPTAAASGYTHPDQMGAMQVGRSFDNVDVELGHSATPSKSLRRCRSCGQWMSLHNDSGEQISCRCPHGSEEYSDCDDDDNNSRDSNSSSRGDNQIEEHMTDGHLRLDSQQSSSSSCNLVSPHSSSSITSFTPSESPSGVLGSADAHNSRVNAFSNFVVSPNPPIQLIESKLPVSPSTLLSATSNAKSDLESELKSSSTALSRASSGATAFLRSRFALGSSSSPLLSSSQALFQLPPTHSFTANGQVFTLDTRYTLLKSIGTGAYGAVIAVQDSSADVSVAVKKITNIFEDLVDAKRILREVRLLHHFQHKNITRLLDLPPPVSKAQFEDMYIITELMETDLHQVIYSMQPMSDDHVKYFLYQMLCALHHIHSAGVIHRDMKPSNVLLNSNCDLKICDFGLARGGMPTPSTHSGQPRRREELTEYVVTRWYRAPEIMLNCLQYTEAIDVWAVGCIFAEMLLREPLFPGNDYIHQLKLIIKFLGTPKQEDIEFVKNAKALRFLTKLAISKPKKWRDVFAGGDEEVNPLAIDLLSQMLHFNPAKRISVESALRHPYLATFYDQADITSAREFDFSFDLPDDKLSREALVDLLCEDIAHFHALATDQPTASTASTNSSRYFSMGTMASAS